MIGILAKITKEQSSFSGDALLQTNYADDFTVRGNAFLFEKIITIASGESAFVLWDYTTFLPAPGQIGQVFVYKPFFETTAGPVTVNLYRGTNYAGGTQFLAYNPNTNHAKQSSSTTLTLGPTGTVKGTLSMEYLVGGQGLGNQSGAGSTAGLSFFIVNNTRKSLVEIVNGSGKEIKFHYGQMLYEI